MEDIKKKHTLVLGRYENGLFAVLPDAEKELAIMAKIFANANEDNIKKYYLMYGEDNVKNFIEKWKS